MRKKPTFRRLNKAQRDHLRTLWSEGKDDEEIAKIFNDEGTTTPGKGKPWGSSSVGHHRHLYGMMKYRHKTKRSYKEHHEPRTTIPKATSDDLAMAELVLTSNMPDAAKRRVLRSLIAG